MMEQRRLILSYARRFLDLLIMVLCFGLAASAEIYSIKSITFGQFFSMRIKLHNILLFVGFLLIWYFIFAGVGLYHSKRLSTWRSEVIDILKATSMGTLTIFILSILFNVRMINNIFLVVFWASCTCLTIVGRLSGRYILKQFRIRGRNLRSMLIIGTNSRAVRFARRIESRPELGYRIIGFVDKNWAGIGEFYNAGYELVTNLGELADFLRDNVIDEVVIALPVSSYYDRISQIISLCEEQGIIFRYLADFFNTKLAHSRLDPFDDGLFLTHSPGTLMGLPVLVKRVLDITLSLILIFLLSPLFIIAALLIKIFSPGPVFFIQERLGFNKRRFRLYKFRTMISGAEEKQAELEPLNEVKGPAFKIKNDPRITPLGRILRKTSIDELPQLFNVLLGDMSLVGPRPLPIRDYNNFQQDWHRRRFSIRPGMTCLWQVNGRNHCSFDKWMELDMQYIDNWSFWLDLKILLKTIPAVLKGSGAE